MEYGNENEALNALVRRIFYIDDMVIGSEKQNFLVRYHGHLLCDSEEAYDQLSASLKPMNLTPLFRLDGDRQMVVIISGMPRTAGGNSKINLLLFILTVLSVLYVGFVYNTGREFPSTVSDLFSGWPFAVSLMGILSAHEFGHYLVGRYHGTPVSLPYFLPIPIPPFGTLGAFINMKAPPKNRNHLLDIGLAGPLCGLVIAIPVLLIGLSHSPLEAIPMANPQGFPLEVEGNSILYLLSKFAVFGQLLPHPTTYGAVSPALYWIKYWLTGIPFPFGGLDVTLNQVAWAGWGGLLVTSLNLIPAGQLDGGHALYVLLGRKRATRVLPFILIAIAVLGFFWMGWWLWAALIFFLGRAYAEPLDQITPLDNKRKALAVLGLIVFILVFIPVPFIASVGFLK